jgi:soluble lytic murein transglycosylase-like protein
MDHIHTLSVVSPLSGPLRPVTSIAPSRRAPRLLLASLMLNGGLALGAGAAAMSIHARLADLANQTRSYAQATDRYAQGLATLGDESRSLADGLGGVRTALRTHASEESLFMKTLILKPGVNHGLARRIAAAVQRECMLSGQDPNLVLSVMAVESDFNPRAVSPVGAVGLMQVMPLWKKALEVDDLSHPETSIHAGVKILQHYQQLYGKDVDLMLTAYNRGPTQVNEALASGVSPANGYSAKVRGLAQRLDAIDVSARP